MSRDKIIGVIGDALTGVTGGLTQRYSEPTIEKLHEHELKQQTRSLANAIIETTANLKGKRLSARALRRAEARKLKTKYK